MQRLIEVVGWPALALGAAVVVAAVPALRSWLRFELRLAARVMGYGKPIDWKRDDERGAW